MGKELSLVGRRKGRETQRKGGETRGGGNGETQGIGGETQDTSKGGRMSLKNAY